MREVNLKALLCDHVLQNYRDLDCILGIEIPYALGRRRADFVLVCGEFMHAFEIKSSFDSLRNLEHQLRDMSLTFDYSTLVTTKKHVQNSRLVSSGKVGLICLEEGGRKLLERRKATQVRRLNKAYVSGFLTKEDMGSLLKLERSKSKRADVEKIRSLFVSKFITQDIRLFARNSLRSKYQNPFKIFMRERGQFTHPDDLRLFQFMSRQTDLPI